MAGSAAAALPWSSFSSSLSSSATGSPLLPPFVPGLSASSSSSSLSSGSPSPLGGGLLASSSSSHSVRVRHDKQRRNASEVRRRGEMRDAFRALQSVSSCPHAGRYNVLTHATQLIQRMQRSDTRDDTDAPHGTDTHADSDETEQQQQQLAGDESTVAVGGLASVSGQSAAPSLPPAPPPSAAPASSASFSSSTSISAASMSASSSPLVSAQPLSAPSANAYRSLPSSLCALSVCQWLPVASCVCELSGELLAVNPPLLQLLDCPSVAFCLQRNHSLWSLIDHTDAQRIRQALGREQQQQPPEQSTVKRVKSEDGTSQVPRGVQREPMEDGGYDTRRRPPLEASYGTGGGGAGGGVGGSAVSSAAAMSSSFRPVSLPLPVRSLGDIFAARFTVLPSSSAASMGHPTASTHQATGAAARLTHSAAVALLTVSGASRPAQLSVSIASVRDPTTNEWRAAMLCLFSPLLATAVEGDTASSPMAAELSTRSTAAATASVAEDEDEANVGEPFTDWANHHRDSELLRARHQHQPLQPQHTRYTQPSPQRHAPSSMSYLPGAFSWPSSVDVDRFSLLPLPLSAQTADSASAASFPRTTLASDPSTMVQPGTTLSSRPRYTSYGALTEINHAQRPVPQSSTPSSVSDSTAHFPAEYGSGVTSAPYHPAPLLASSSTHDPALMQQQQQLLNTGAALSLSPKSLAHRVLSNLYR